MAYPRSTHTTTRALTYSYIHIAPQSPNAQYILFLHGFPSTSHAWRHQISFFAAKGHGILAPDLLGFGATSKPGELEMYKGEAMARDIVEILDCEGVGAVVGVAHDWYVFCLVALFQTKRGVLSDDLGAPSSSHASQTTTPTASRPTPSSTTATTRLAAASRPPPSTRSMPRCRPSLAFRSLAISCFSTRTMLRRC
jgi:pimeloyl-ACP methyl ester carboxylesterase